MAVLSAVLPMAAATAPLSGPIFINEVAWAGASWRPTAEWIELYNASSEPVDLAGWRLASSDGSPDIALHGTILPSVGGDPMTGFFLLERDDDHSVPDVAADLIYSGALTNRGETLYLYDSNGDLADTANAEHPPGSAWPAGSEADGVPPFASMERIDYRAPDSEENWSSSTADPLGHSSAWPLRGTPRRENSVFNVLPSPSFTQAPHRAVPGSPIEFNASGSFDENDHIVTYHWDFGDDTEGSGLVVQHTYDSPGEYRVLLTLIDAKGGQAQVSRLVRVQAQSPPIADFSLVPLPPSRIPRAGDPIRFQDESSDPDGRIVAREWRFGEGVTASDAEVVHTFELSGTYPVSLRVLDDSGDDAVQTQSVRIASRVPIAAFTSVPARPNAGDSVRFDASASHDPDGHIELYRWDFGESGNRTYDTSDPVVDHVFRTGGERSIRLIVVDDTADVSDPTTETLSVNIAPVAAFQLCTFEANELAPVRFNDNSHDEDGSILAWSWDFGDGTHTEMADPEHVFEDNGSFAVRLTVTDDNGASDTTVAELTILNLPPTAQLTCASSTRPTGEAFRFDASGSIDPSPHGAIVTYEWDLDGDGHFELISNSPTISHTYDDDGTYTVRVRVTDDDGSVILSDPLSVVSTNRAPRIRQIAWTPFEPTDSDDVCFSAVATDQDGEVVHWFWNVDDRPTVNTKQISACCLHDGQHTITLTVEDDDGARSDPLSVDIVIDNAPPVADFAPVILGERCAVFDARDSHDPSPTGTILHVAWDFGDGTSCPGTPSGCGTGNRLAPTHCYSEGGTYIVTLVVIDEQGALAQTTRTIYIAE